MTDTAFGHQLAIAGVVVWLIQLLKRVGWFPLLTNNTDVANRIVSVVTAIVVGAGVTISVQGGLSAGGGVLIKWPAVATMVNGATHAVLQFMLQEGVYRKLVK